MKRPVILSVACAAACGLCARAGAAPKPDAGTRESLVVSGRLVPVSAGADLERFSREIVWNNGGAGRLEGRRLSAFLGFEPVPWLTAFATAGETRADAGGGSSGGESGWSVGAGANLWHYDLADPEFLAGRLSLRGGLEYLKTDFEDYRFGPGEWEERSVSVTLNYEIYVEGRKARSRVPYSLLLYAGRAVSEIDGKVGPAGARREFEERRSSGWVYGTDLFVSANLSVGMHLQRFESTAWRASLRYRF